MVSEFKVIKPYEVLINGPNIVNIRSSTNNDKSWLPLNVLQRRGEETLLYLRSRELKSIFLTNPETKWVISNEDFYTPLSDKKNMDKIFGLLFKNKKGFRHCINWQVRRKLLKVLLVSEQKCTATSQDDQQQSMSRQQTQNEIVISDNSNLFSEANGEHSGCEDPGLTAADPELKNALENLLQLGGRMD